jgi:hypothetical protein
MSLGTTHLAEDPCPLAGQSGGSDNPAAAAHAVADGTGSVPEATVVPSPRRSTSLSAA